MKGVVVDTRIGRGATWLAVTAVQAWWTQRPEQISCTFCDEAYTKGRQNPDCGRCGRGGCIDRLGLPRVPLNRQRVRTINHLQGTAHLYPEAAVGVCGGLDNPRRHASCRPSRLSVHRSSASISLGLLRGDVVTGTVSPRFRRRAGTRVAVFLTVLSYLPRLTAASTCSSTFLLRPPLWPST